MEEIQRMEAKRIRQVIRTCTPWSEHTERFLKVINGGGEDAWTAYRTMTSVALLRDYIQWLKDEEIIK